MSKYLKLIVLFGFLGKAYAQQMPQYSQYLRNQFMINPGAAGVYDFTDVTLSGRMQWLGFANAPQSTYLSVSSVVGNKSAKEKYNPSLHYSTGIVPKPEIKTGKLKHAVGVQLMADQYGAFRQINCSGTYAVHVPLSRKVNASFGVKGGITSHTFLQDRAQVLNPLTDNTYSAYIVNQGNRNILTLGAGFYVYSSRFFAGVSADQLTGQKIGFGSGTANFDTRIHFNVMAGTTIDLSDDFTLTPAFLVKYMSPAPVSVEGTLQVEYKKWLWGGVSYRYKDAIVSMVGLNLSRRFKFGYSYDFSVSRFSTYSSGGHELILGIMLR